MIEPHQAHPRLVGLLAVLLMLGLGCGEEATPPTPEVDSETASPVARESRAKELFAKGMVAEKSLKVESFREVVQLYWDTATAPPALHQLVLCLIDPPEKRFDEALRELERFEKHRPDAPELCTAADNLGRSLWDGKAAADGSVEARTYEAWRRIAEHRAGNGGGFPVHVTWGTALVALGRHAEAARVWASTDALKDVPAKVRFPHLITRADLADQRLGDQQAAIALYRRALELSKELDGRATKMPATWARERLAVLEK